MECKYCEESELPKLITEIIQLSRKQRKNINIVPQFLGQHPRVCSYGPTSMSYKTIILAPWPPVPKLDEPSST